MRINGVLVGRVGDIRLTDNDGSVLVTLDIHSDKTIYQNEMPNIIRDFMGNTAVVFIPSMMKAGAAHARRAAAP